MQPILKIDLTTGTSEEYRSPKNGRGDFLGGASLAARILYSSLTRELDPLSTEAPLLFLMGPMTGTSGPTTGRFVVCRKGPATVLWAESNVGGFWGPELRAAGYDGLWITGKAFEPVYLWLDGSRLEVRSAAHLWGQNTYTTQDRVKEEVGEKSARVCVIGPAGERGVLFASILCDHGRMSGRTGLGAVMGSKNLKAIAVHGTNPIPVYDLTRYALLRSEANRALKQDNEAKVLRDLGTAGAANYSEYMGAMPVKYYSHATFENVDNISGARMTETILTGRSACQGCVIACGRVVKLGDRANRKGPEYETVAGFGPNLMNDNRESIVDLGELCDRYGIDTISCGNTIGLAFHLFEKGIVPEKEIGFELKWGDVDSIERLVNLIGRREGIGEFLQYAPQIQEAVERGPFREGSLQLVLADGSVYPHRGTGYLAGREIDPRTGTITVKGDFPNPGQALRPGQYARVRVETGMVKGALVVPQRAIQDLQGLAQLTVVGADDKVEVRTVTKGPAWEGLQVISQGVSAGERVVVEGFQKVRPGMAVVAKPVPAEPALAAPEQTAPPSGETGEAES